MLLLLMAGLPVLADEFVNDTKQGTIRGRIIDNSQQTLPGAIIYIESLHTGVVSDINGFYTLANLTPGTYKIKVSYVGYSPVEMTITIPEGKTVERNVTLNEGIELQEVVVGGAFTGQRRAINAQKNSMGITNIVSADQVGKFPDSNIGDALKRISGINVQYDQGEARFGQVRGTSADLSSVTINGNRIPSAEGDTRNVQLDLIPADMVQTIEVNKVVTADMDGDAIGGSINLVTKNTPYKRIFNATAGSGYNAVSKKAQLNLGLTYGDRFFNDKLGLMISGSYQYAPGGSDNTEFEYDVDDDGNVVLKEAQVRQYYVTRERQSYSLALDYEFNPNHKISFKGIITYQNAVRHRNDFDISPQRNIAVQFSTEDRNRFGPDIVALEVQAAGFQTSGLVNDQDVPGSGIEDIGISATAYVLSLPPEDFTLVAHFLQHDAVSHPGEKTTAVGLREHFYRRVYLGIRFSGFSMEVHAFFRPDVLAGLADFPCRVLLDLVSAKILGYHDGVSILVGGQLGIGLDPAHRAVDFKDHRFAPCFLPVFIEIKQGWGHLVDISYRRDS